MKAKQLESKHGKSLGDILIEAFNEHKTQENVAAALGVSQSTISLWIKLSGLEVTHHYTLTEKGKNALSASKAAALAVESGLSGVELG